MTGLRSLLLLPVFVLAGSASSSSQVPAAAVPSGQPGYPTIAQVRVLNTTRADAVAVKVQTGGDVLPVSVIGVPTVALLPTTIVGTKSTRQAWEYRQVTTGANQDPTAALNAAGNDGWEAVNAIAGASGTVWTLKRPR